MEDAGDACVRHYHVDDGEEGQHEHDHDEEEHFDKDVASFVARDAVVRETHDQLLAMRMGYELKTSTWKTINITRFISFREQIVYFLLLVFDGKLESTQAVLLHFVLEESWRILVVVVEDYLELLWGARLGEQRARILLTLLRELLVVELELVFDLGQALELPAQLKRRQDGIFARERDERRTG